MRGLGCMSFHCDRHEKEDSTGNTPKTVTPLLFLVWRKKCSRGLTLQEVGLFVRPLRQAYLSYSPCPPFPLFLQSTPTHSLKSCFGPLLPRMSGQEQAVTLQDSLTILTNAHNTLSSLQNLLDKPSVRTIDLSKRSVAWGEGVDPQNAPVDTSPPTSRKRGPTKMRLMTQGEEVVNHNFPVGCEVRKTSSNNLIVKQPGSNGKKFLSITSAKKFLGLNRSGFHAMVIKEGKNLASEQQDLPVRREKEKFEVGAAAAVSAADNGSTSKRKRRKYDTREVTGEPADVPWTAFLVFKAKLKETASNPDTVYPSAKLFKKTQIERNRVLFEYWLPQSDAYKKECEAIAAGNKVVYKLVIEAWLKDKDEEFASKWRKKRKGKEKEVLKTELRCTPEGIEEEEAEAETAAENLITSEKWKRG